MEQSLNLFSWWGAIYAPQLGPPPQESIITLSELAVAQGWGGLQRPYVSADMGAPPGPVWFCSLEGWLINLLCEENIHMTLSSGRPTSPSQFSNWCPLETVEVQDKVLIFRVLRVQTGSSLFNPSTEWVQEDCAHWRFPRGRIDSVLLPETL